MLSIFDPSFVSLSLSSHISCFKKQRRTFLVPKMWVHIKQWSMLSRVMLYGSTKWSTNPSTIFAWLVEGLHEKATQWAAENDTGLSNLSSNIIMSTVISVYCLLSKCEQCMATDKCRIETFYSFKQVWFTDLIATFK